MKRSTYFISSDVCVWSYKPPKLWESQLWQFHSHLGVLGQNAIWMWALWKGVEYTIRGKVVASSKSKLWWVLWSLSCPWLVLAPNVFQLCTNHLVLDLCKPVWVSEACQFFLVSSRSSSMPLYLFKVLRTKERAPDSLLFHYFLFGTHILVPQGVGSTSFNISWFSNGNCAKKFHS